ncbi:hypothetical protein SZ64_02345 [Erythrobacter sp. SG61-1L]|uniref:VOC family protein n=1 Tax=Erythrobacter sp. SG61-1L TaxID=1603897 RepID=UPI0006D6E8FE|nr:VOC family protein [Erythrobacter sp. SG61-1L]KPL67033.1 hypothetical protein SZ64_02345 [Erythrobacter sp. SG61-1L]
MMAGFPIWYELMTPDAAAIGPFYRATAGLDIPAEGTMMPNGAEYRMIGRPDGGNAGGALTLTPAMIEGGAMAGWLPYFHCPDIDAALLQAKALGGQLWMDQTIPGTGRMAMLSDPQGAPFYIMNPVPPPGMPDAKSDVFDAAKPGHCRWMQLDTTDAPAANAFYTALFDWKTDQTMPMGAAGDYRFIECEGQQIGAINPMIAEGASPAWLLFFGVEDIDTARKAAQANGGTATQDIHQVPSGDFIFMARDPAGAAVAFVGPRKGAA